MVKRVLGVSSILLLLVFFTSQPVLALRTRGNVLGASTVTMPPTTEGPGMFMPGDPLFFLDPIKQSLRVTFAPTPEDKANVYLSIAGERYAELRYQLAKNNKEGIDVDLKGFADNVKLAADSVAAAKFSGKNVEKLALQVNDALTAKQQALDSLELQATGELQAKFALAGESLMAAKEKVEDNMSDRELAKAIQDDLHRMALKHAVSTSASASNLLLTLQDLQDQASDNAQESLNNRQEALKKAIADKNIALQKQDEAVLAAEIKKQNDAYKVSSDEIKQVQAIITQAQATAKNLQNQ